MAHTLLRNIKKAFGYTDESKSASLLEPVAFEIFGSLPTASGAVVNANTALQVPAVLQAVRLIAETIGSLPCKLYSETDDAKLPAKTHSAYRLVHDRVSGFASAGQFREELTADAIMHGAGYAHVIRVADDRPYALKRLPPQSVQRRFADDGDPFYIVTDAQGRQHRLSYRDVLYLPAFGSVSPVNLGKRAIGLAMVLERQGEQFFRSGARPSGVFTNEKAQGGEAGAKTVDNIRKSFRTWQADANGDPLILDAGWTYDQPAMKSTDAQFIENRVEQTNEIARLFGIPPHLIFQLDRATWSNAEQMGATFLQLCLRRWLDKWQDAYATVLLTEAEQRDHYFEFVIDDLQRADAAGRADVFGKLIAARAMTPNEARAAMNLPPLPGGDDLANPYTTITTTGPALASAKEAV